MSKFKNLINRARGALGVTHQEPPVEHAAPPEVERRGQAPAAPEPVPEPDEPASHFWPKKEPLPTSWSKRLLPCPECRRVQLPTGSQAAACQSTRGDFAYFRCRACGHTWKLAVRP